MVKLNRFTKNLKMSISNVNLTYFKIPQGSKILDIGIGNGERSLNFARRGFLIYALDSSEEVITRFKKRLENYDSLAIQVVHARAENLPFSDNFFEGILMIETLEHIAQEKKALKEVYRVIKKRGFFCLGIPTYRSECLYNFLNPRYLKKAGHIHIFKKEKLLCELNSLGFKTLKVKKENFIPAFFWILNSFFKINPTSIGETNKKALLTQLYFNFWGALHVLRMAEPLQAVGNQIFPKSIYIYCQKE